MDTAIYVHIPFCIKKCKYCSFNSIPYDKYIAERYAQALKAEIRLIREAKPDLHLEPSSLYIGGGTPTVLAQETLFGLIEVLVNELDIPAGTEATVEANPGAMGGLDLKALLSLGINRVSLGVQSFDPGELAMLGRIHGPTDVSSSFVRLRAAGFDNISLDLIYSLPGQDIKRWESNLDEAISLGPEHISTYDLGIEEGTALYGELKAGALKLPPEPVQVEMYLMAVETLEAAGYKRYEISNFARPGFECRHNINYWSCGEYIGLGAGAHSYSGGVRSKNTDSVNGYIEALGAGRSPVTEEETLTVDDMKREFVMLGLRKSEGFSLEDYKCRFGGDMLNEKYGIIGNLTKAGYLVVAGGFISLTTKGVLASNYVIRELF